MLAVVSRDWQGKVELIAAKNIRCEFAMEAELKSHAWQPRLSPFNHLPRKKIFRRLSASKHRLSKNFSR